MNTDQGHLDVQQKEGQLRGYDTYWEETEVQGVDVTGDADGVVGEVTWG